MAARPYSTATRRPGTPLKSRPYRQRLAKEPVSPTPSLLQSPPAIRSTGSCFAKAVAEIAKAHHGKDPSRANASAWEDERRRPRLSRQISSIVSPLVVVSAGKSVSRVSFECIVNHYRKRISLFRSTCNALYNAVIHLSTVNLGGGSPANVLSKTPKPPRSGAALARVTRAEPRALKFRVS